uniref:Mannose binding lectin n=1 Tax=Microsorum sp. SU-2018 TaxID=2079548 RepID=A0A455IET4_9MONI|nr:mannose binding lectin [Microsorum sp. SU-2018]
MAQPGYAGNVLLEGYVLNPGASLAEGPYSLHMQTDCNLVLYKNGNQPLWASNTFQRGTGCYLIMQTDGNAVVYTSASQAVWATGTNGRNDGAHYLILQTDGNLVMYNGGGTPIWASGTNGRLASESLDGRKLLRGAEPGGVLASFPHN